jgi:hypothetical protein
VLDDARPECVRSYLFPVNDTALLVVLGLLLLVAYRALFRWLDVRRGAPTPLEHGHGMALLPEQGSPAA